VAARNSLDCDMHQLLEAAPIIIARALATAQAAAYHAHHYP
jgi:hypothetical protein